MSGALVLCNEALALLAEISITSFEEETPVAQSCKLLVPNVLAQVLVCSPWKFTMRRARLARLADAPASEWLYAHQLPSENLVLRAIRTTAEPDTGVLLHFEVNGRQVLSNEPDLWAEYQASVDPADWPAYVRTIGRYALAADLAVAVVGSNTAASTYRAFAFGTPSEGGNGGAVAAARKLDSQQQPAQQLRQFPLAQARHSAGFWRR